MNKLFSLVLLLLVSSISHSTEIKPFYSECIEGNTHRYDGGNGLTMTGDKGDFNYGWSTEKWGGIKINWDGGKIIKLGKLNAVVLSASNGVISAAWSGDNGIAVNLYSFIIDVHLGEAVYSQVQTSSLGKNRSIKVRSQNLKCTIK